MSRNHGCWDRNRSRDHGCVSRYWNRNRGCVGRYWSTEPWLCGMVLEHGNMAVWAGTGAWIHGCVGRYWSTSWLPDLAFFRGLLEAPWTSKRQAGSQKRVRKWRLALRATRKKKPCRQQAPQPRHVGHLHLCLFEYSLFVPSRRGSTPLGMITLKGKV